MKFKEGDSVIVSRLGDKHPGKYRAIIRGIASSLGPYGFIWILEWVDGFPVPLGPEIFPNYEFSCSTMIESCIDYAGNEDK